MRQAYKVIKMVPASLARLDQINDILDEFQEQNFCLTIRQLYYQLVSKEIIPNSMRSYKQLIDLMNSGRLSGLVDWDMIEDRTREFRGNYRYTSPKQLLTSAARNYHIDMWDDQKVRPYLVVEKEALSGVFEGVCAEFDMPMLTARGYPSISVLREFVQQYMVPHSEQGAVVFHFGDHDPSGIDMTRDLRDRIELLNNQDAGALLDIRRIALNTDQIKKYRPPPNPAKLTDSRIHKYVARFGKNSWELDALSPKVLNALVKEHVTPLIDAKKWNVKLAKIAAVRKKITKLANTYK